MLNRIVNFILVPRTLRVLQRQKERVGGFFSYFTSSVLYLYILKTIKLLEKASGYLLLCHSFVFFVVWLFTCNHSTST